MRCIECSCCKKGWFPSRPDAYVCIGTPEPFVIDNLYAECYAYPEKRDYISIADAIDHFKHGITHDIFSEPVTTYAKMAVEALEKRILMEHHNTNVGEIHDEKARSSICPNCLGWIITVPEEFPRFCPWCGQAINWERRKIR